MTRYTFHIPLQLNDGTPTPEFELGQVEQALLIHAGGFTSTDSTGAWADADGVVYREPMRLIFVDVEDDLARTFQELAQSIGKRLGQEAVYLTAAPIEAWVVITEAIIEA